MQRKTYKRLTESNWGQFMQLFESGCTPEQIADQLGISLDNAKETIDAIGKADAVNFKSIQAMKAGQHARRSKAWDITFDCLSDSALIQELRRRGYTGTITKTISATL